MISYVSYRFRSAGSSSKRTQRFTVSRLAFWGSAFGVQRKGESEPLVLLSCRFSPLAIGVDADRRPPTADRQTPNAKRQTRTYPARRYSFLPAGFVFHLHRTSRASIYFRAAG